MDKRALETLQASLQQAFPADEAQITTEVGFDVSKGVRRWFDIVLNHRTWGLYVIEVKGFSVENVREGFSKYWSVDRRRQNLYVPLAESTSIIQSLATGSSARSELPIHAMIGLPFVDAAILQNRNQDNVFLNRSIIFREDLIPERLRQKLENAPVLSLDSPRKPKARPDQDEYRIFISYRREDSKWAAGRLADRLKSEFGANAVFFDTSDIPGGNRWKQILTERLEQTSILIAVMGDRWLTSAHPESGKRRLDDPNDIVKFEIHYALTNNLQVFPVIVDSRNLPAESHLPPKIKKLFDWNAKHMFADTFDRDVAQIISDIKTSLSPKAAARKNV